MARTGELMMSRDRLVTYTLFDGTDIVVSPIAQIIP